MKILNDFEQGSMEWLQARCGKITMSHAKALLAGGKGKTRKSYVYDVLSESLSGEPVEGYRGLDMERGNFLEPLAVEAFTAMMGLEVTRVGFVLQDDERIGCSPDGFAGDESLVEIKCPKPRQHIKNIFADGIEEYRQQCQGNMWVCERETCYVVSFCPWVKDKPIFIKRINRDRNVIQKLSVSAHAAADEVESIAQVVKAAMSPAEVLQIATKARDAWDNVLADNSEVRL